MGKVSVLDHGYLEFVESWGSDESIVRAARMSTDKGFLGWGPQQCADCVAAGRIDPRDNHYISPAHREGAINAKCKCKGKGETPGDEKLLKYLYEHRHDTPFEMAGMVIEVQAPIMVFREWHRHRTQSYNEMSARYTPLPDVNYMPTPGRCLTINGANKQANAIAGVPELTHEAALAWLEKLADLYTHAQAVYQAGLDVGIPKELARLPVPVGRYSKMRASTNLRNWLGFLTLRMDEAAQWEIRQFANVVGSEIEARFPKTWELFKLGR